MTSSSSETPETRLVAVPKIHTAARLTALEDRADNHDRDLARLRQVLRASVAGLSTGLLVALGLIVYLLIGRADSRSYYNDQIRMLVCAVPPGDETRNLLRERANCGPYTPPASPGSSSASRPDSTPRQTITGEAQLAPATPTTPSSSGTASRPTARSATTPTKASSSAARTPRRGVPTLPTRVTTPTVPHTTAPTPRGLLPELLCILLNCPDR